MKLRTILFLSVLLVGVLAGADAFACTVWQTSAGVDLHFKPGVVEYYIQRDGTPDVEGGGEFEAIQAAFQAWGNADCDGGLGVEFVYAGETDVEQTNYDPRRFLDQKNMVTFVQNGWEGDPSVLARARVLWNTSTGEIMEFGIALNDTNVDWSTSETTEPSKFDVQSVVMREIGLAMGLGTSEDPNAVMRGGFTIGIADRRMLGADDHLAMCDLYVTGRDYELVPEDAVCARDFHPGAQPDENNGNNGANNGGNNGANNGANNGGNNGANNGGNNGGNNDGGMRNRGAGENCSQDLDCLPTLICGCPLESCAANLCYEPMDEEPEPEPTGDDKDEGCATVSGTPAAPLFLLALGLGAFALRRR